MGRIPGLDKLRDIFKWTASAGGKSSNVALYAITPKYDFGDSSELEFGEGEHAGELEFG